MFRKKTFSGPARAFVSYAHEDEKALEELRRHLAPLVNEGTLSFWYDREIEAGAEWEGVISERLEDAQIILLLVSVHFMNSKYCYNTEMAKAMQRHDAGEARIVPIILRPVDWEATSFAKLQALPKDGKPVFSWRNRDEAWTEVAKNIRAICSDISQPLESRVNRSPSEPGKIVASLLPKKYMLYIMAMSASAFFIYVFLSTFKASSCELLEENVNLRTGATFEDCECCPQMVVLPNGSIMARHETTVGNYRSYLEDEGGIINFAIDKILRFGEPKRCYVFGWQGEKGDFFFDPSKDWANPGYYQEDNSPVVCVNWNDAQNYAQWLSRKTKKHYRLPNFDEMKYATQAGTDSDVPWVNTNDACRYSNIHDLKSVEVNEFPWQHAECDDGYPLKKDVVFAQTAPFADDGRFQPNGFGIYHSIGNVYEWLGNAQSCDIAGQTGIWGGSFTSAPDKARAISGFCQSKEFRAYDIGFRLVRDR